MTTLFKPQEPINSTMPSSKEVAAAPEPAISAKDPAIEEATEAAVQSTLQKVPHLETFLIAGSIHAQGKAGDTAETKNVFPETEESAEETESAFKTSRFAISPNRPAEG